MFGSLTHVAAVGKFLLASPLIANEAPPPPMEAEGVTPFRGGRLGGTNNASSFVASPRGWGAAKLNAFVPSLVAQAPVSRTGRGLCFRRHLAPPFPLLPAPRRARANPGSTGVRLSAPDRPPP